MVKACKQKVSDALIPTKATFRIDDIIEVRAFLKASLLK